MNERERLGLRGLLRQLGRRPAGHFRNCGAVAAGAADAARMALVWQRAARCRFGRRFLVTMLGMVVPGCGQVRLPVLQHALRFMRMVTLHRAEQHRRSRDSLEGNGGHDQPCEKNAPERHTAQILQKPRSLWGRREPKTHKALEAASSFAACVCELRAATTQPRCGGHLHGVIAHLWQTATPAASGWAIQLRLPRAAPTAQ